MQTRERIIKALEGISYLLLMFLSFAWFYFFYLIAVYKKVVCVEPNKTLLLVELIITPAVGFLGLILFIRFLKSKGGKNV